MASPVEDPIAVAVSSVLPAAVCKWAATDAAACAGHHGHVGVEKQFAHTHPQISMPQPTTHRWHPVQRRSSIAVVTELDVHAGPLLHDGSGIGAVTVGGLLTEQCSKFPDHEALIGGCS